MKNFYPLILSTIFLLSGAGRSHGQVSPGDYQFTLSVSENLQAPTRMAISHQDKIFVTDAYAKQIKIFNSNGNPEGVLEVIGIPLSLAVNNNHEVFYGEAVSGNIYKINNFGSSTLFYSGCQFPNSLSFSPDNKLYVADSRQGKILVLSSDGTLAQTIGEGMLVYPSSVDYDWKNNRLLVGEHGGSNNNLQAHIYIFNPDGTLINTLGTYGSGNGSLYRVQGVKAGRCGNIYVCEPFQGNISVFKENGIFLTKFGQFGLTAGKLNTPMDIAFDSQERIWISSMNNKSLEIFTILDSLPSASVVTCYQEVCEGQNADIEIRLTGQPPWSLTYTIDGQNAVTVNNINSSPYHLFVTQEGNYRVTAVTDATTEGNCFSGSATVVVNSVPTAEIPPMIPVVCAGQKAEIPVYFTGNSPWAFIYTVNGVNPVTINNINISPFVLEVTEPGTYTITEVRGPLCEGTVLQATSLVTVSPKPVSAFSTQKHFLRVDFFNNSLEATHFHWNFGDQQSSNLVNPSHTYSHSGHYTVTLSAWNDYCRAYNFIQTVDVISSEDTSSVNNDYYDKRASVDFSNFTVEIYPNPAQDIVTLEMKKAVAYRADIEILNITGQIVYRDFIDFEGYSPQGQSFSKHLDLRGLSNGAYTIKIMAGFDTRNLRLVINR